MEKLMQKRIVALILFLFTLAFFIVRLPAYIAPLSGEEGIHANIFFTQPANPDYLQIARINGVDLYTFPQHPAFLYEILGILGSIWKGIFNTQNLNPKQLSVFVRVAVSTIQYCVFLVFLLIVLMQKKIEWKNKLLLSLSVIVIAISGPAIKMSVSVQIDGSVGVLLAGILSIAIISYALKIFSDKLSFVFLFLGSILFGFGKNEWSLALLVTLILSIIFILVSPLKSNSKQEKKRWFSLLGIIFFGLILGNLINYWFDSFNYLAGFGVMFGISKGSTFFGVMNTLRRAPFTYVNILILTFLFYSLIKSIRKPDFFLFFIFVFSALMFIAYFAISWGTDPRYYAPSLVIGSTGLVLASNYYSEKRIKPLIIGIFCILLLHTSISFYHGRHSLPDYLTLDTYTENTSNQSACLPFTDAGKVFGTKFDFITNSLSFDDAKSIASNYNKDLCK